MTDDVLEKLQTLQKAISRLYFPPRIDEDTEKLYFAEIDGLFHVDFYGSPFSEEYDALLELLTDPGVAVCLRSLVFRGPDEGANGTRPWDFTRLLGSDVVFPNLTSLFIEPTAPEHHNHSIIGGRRSYEEDGQIALLVAKMPALVSLTVPSAPDASFFTATHGFLVILRVDTGYDHQNFIQNLSEASCFPALKVLDFGDYNQRYSDEYPFSCVPFEQYANLFRSSAFATVGRFNLRNAALSAAQFAELRRVPWQGSFYAIQSFGDYVRPQR